MTSNTSKLLNQQIYVGLHGLRKAFVKPQFYLLLETLLGSTGYQALFTVPLTLRSNLTGSETILKQRISLLSF